MAKSLKKGACNADTMDELYEKFNRTPDTIDGLYQHMLDKLDGSYLSEAFRHFGRLIWSEERSSWRLPPTLLDFVFAESEPSEYVPWNNREYFTSPEFMHHCLSVETRILTRCAGLVEIQDQEGRSQYGDEFLDGVSGYFHDPESGTFLQPIPVSPDEQNPSRHVREVRFIHKTVGDFLRNRHENLAHDPNELSAAAFALVRGQLGTMNLIPIMVDRSELDQKVSTFFPFMEAIMDDLIKLEESEAVQNTHHAFGDTIIIMVNQIYRDIECIDAALNGPAVSWFERYKYGLTDGALGLYRRLWPVGRGFNDGFRRLPFHDPSGFAAFFGCQSHVLHSDFLHSCYHKHMDYLLACSITGLQLSGEGFQPHRVIASFTIIRELLHQGASWDSTLFVESELWAEKMVPLSAWTAFLSFMEPAICPHDRPTAQMPKGTTNSDSKQLARVNKLMEEIITHFLADGVDVNSSIFSIIMCHSHKSSGPTLLMALEETPLSLMGVTAVSPGRGPLGILVNWLRFHGGLERRRCHFIKLLFLYEGHKFLYEENKRILRDLRSSKDDKQILEDRWYRLSQPQSDCLCNILHSYAYAECFISFTVPGRDDRFDELILSLTENDLVASTDHEVRSIDESASTNNDDDSLKNETEDGSAENEEDGFGSTGYEDSQDSGDEGADGGNESSVARYGTRE